MDSTKKPLYCRKTAFDHKNSSQKSFKNCKHFLKLCRNFVSPYGLLGILLSDILRCKVHICNVMGTYITNIQNNVLFTLIESRSTVLRDNSCVWSRLRILVFSAKILHELLGYYAFLSLHPSEKLHHSVAYLLIYLKFCIVSSSPPL